jgi:hypothetical protein
MGAGCSTIAEEVIREMEQAQANAVYQQFQQQQEGNLEQVLAQVAIGAIQVAVNMGQQRMEERQRQEQLEQMQHIMNLQHEQAQSHEWLAQHQAAQDAQAQQWLARQQRA